MKHQLLAKDIEDNIERTLSARSEITLQDIICSESLHLHASRAYKQINFDHCLFNADITLLGSIGRTVFHFNNCIFNGAINANSLLEGSTLRLNHCQILKGMEMISTKDIKLAMVASTAKGEFQFNHTSLSSCQMEEFNFSAPTDIDKIDFSDCTIADNNFKEAILANATFNNAIFSSNAIFYRCIFIQSGLQATGNFVGTVFKEDAIFSNSYFSHTALFNDATFEKDALFRYCNYKVQTCKSDFSNTKFRGRVYFDESFFLRLAFAYVSFEKEVSFVAMHSKDISLDRCSFTKGAFFMDAQIEKGDRDSFRIIKNECLKHNNAVDALNYQAKELRILEGQRTWKQDPKEKFVLWLNKWSNDFGTKWVRGVIFTVIVGIMFYCIYLFTLDNRPFIIGWRGWSEFKEASALVIKNFFQFFIVTHSLDFMKDYGPGAKSYAIDTIARIFIGYGIYQTVVAFRKYGK